MGYSDFIQDGFGKHWVSREAGFLHYVEELMDLVTFFSLFSFLPPHFLFRFPSRRGLCKVPGLWWHHGFSRAVESG